MKKSEQRMSRTHKILKPGELRRFLRLHPPIAHGWADAYLKGEKRIEDIDSDCHYYGAVRQVDGVMFLFDDGSSVLMTAPGGNESQAEAVTELIQHGRVPSEVHKVELRCDEGIKDSVMKAWDSYRSGMPVLIFDQHGKLIHGRETVKSISDTGAGMNCMSITGMNREAWERSNAAEVLEVARLAFLEGGSLDAMRTEE